MKHAHAEILHRLADDPDLLVWFWDGDCDHWLQGTHIGVVSEQGWHFALGDKPTSPPKRYAMVEGVRVPMTHLTVAPEGDRQKYWFANSEGMACWDWFVGVPVDANRFANNNCYPTETDCTEAVTAWAQVRKNASERAK